MAGSRAVERVEDGWHVPALRGSGVGEIVLRPGALSLHLGPHGIELMSQADLTTDRGSYWVNAEPQNNLAVFMGLMHQAVADLHVSDAGRLVVDFAGGWRLSVSRIDGRAGWRLFVSNVGIFSVQGEGPLMSPKDL